MRPQVMARNLFGRIYPEQATNRERVEGSSNNRLNSRDFSENARATLKY